METVSSEDEASCTPKEPPKKRKFINEEEKRKPPSRNKKGTRFVAEIRANQGETIAGTAANNLPPVS